ncbi:MAG: Zn-ribbon domain-containing OB-fold protein [Pyrobaculum sp.]
MKFPEVMEIEAYVYTAGVIGTKWLEELRKGRLMAAYCPKCGRLFLPPKSFCPIDFHEVTELRPISEIGVVKSYTVVKRDFYGREIDRVLAYIEFPGVFGGLIHYVRGEVKVGTQVKPRWREGVGIEEFEPC